MQILVVVANIELSLPASSRRWKTRAFLFRQSSISSLWPQHLAKFLTQKNFWPSPSPSRFPARLDARWHISRTQLTWYFGTSLLGPWLKLKLYQPAPSLTCMASALTRTPARLALTYVYWPSQLRPRHLVPHPNVHGLGFDSDPCSTRSDIGTCLSKYMSLPAKTLDSGRTLSWKAFLFH